MLRNLGIRKIVIGMVIIAAILVFGFFFWRAIGVAGGAEEFPIKTFGEKRANGVLLATNFTNLHLFYLIISGDRL